MPTPRPMTVLSNNSDGPFSPVSWHTLSHLEGMKEYQVAKNRKLPIQTLGPALPLPGSWGNLCDCVTAFRNPQN